MESNLTCLEDMMGGMERVRSASPRGVLLSAMRYVLEAMKVNSGHHLPQILKTPVPLFCTHHISRFITSWLFFLPFG